MIVPWFTDLALAGDHHLGWPGYQHYSWHGHHHHDGFWWELGLGLVVPFIFVPPPVYYCGYYSPPYDYYYPDHGYQYRQYKYHKWLPGYWLWNSYLGNWEWSPGYWR